MYTSLLERLGYVTGDKRRRRVVWGVWLGETEDYQFRGLVYTWCISLGPLWVPSLVGSWYHYHEWRVERSTKGGVYTILSGVNRGLLTGWVTVDLTYQVVGEVTTLGDGQTPSLRLERISKCRIYFRTLKGIPSPVKQGWIEGPRIVKSSSLLRKSPLGNKYEVTLKVSKGKWNTCFSPFDGSILLTRVFWYRNKVWDGVGVILTRTGETRSQQSVYFSKGL